MADAKDDVEAQAGRRISAWRIALKSFITQVSIAIPVAKKEDQEL